MEHSVPTDEMKACELLHRLCGWKFDIFDSDVTWKIQEFVFE